MNRSAKHDAARFGVFAFFVITLGAIVTGQAGMYWSLLGIIPVFIVAGALDRRG